MPTPANKSRRSSSANWESLEAGDAETFKSNFQSSRKLGDSAKSRVQGRCYITISKTTMVIPILCMEPELVGSGSMVATGSLVVQPVCIIEKKDMVS